jgi:hypothetical protein
MFVVASRVVNGPRNRLSEWAEKGKLRRMFGYATVDYDDWQRTVVCDEEEIRELVNWKVDPEWAVVFYAKDTQTLRDGLKACRPSAKVVSGRGQISIYCASYDFEGAGGWIKAKIEGALQWESMKKTGKVVKYQAQGLGKSDVIRSKNRERLLQRGHFALVGSAPEMRRMDGVLNTHSEEMSLRTLGNWVN